MSRDRDGYPAIRLPRADNRARYRANGAAKESAERGVETATILDEAEPARLRFLVSRSPMRAPEPTPMRKPTSAPFALRECVPLATSILAMFGVAMAIGLASLAAGRKTSVSVVEAATIPVCR